MDNFFVRFSIQQSLGTFGSEQFSFEEVLTAGKEQIQEYISECDEYQREKAEDLSGVSGDKLIHLQGKKVLFVGDSLTADRLGYRGIVEKAAKIDAYNAAISGATSTDMLRRIYGNILSHNPEIVSVLIGINDSFFEGGKRKVNLVGKKEYRRNLRGILRAASESGAKIIISTLPPIDEKVFGIGEIKSNNNKNVSEYNRIIRTEAMNTGAALVDLAKILENKNIELMREKDGVHLSREGQLVLAEEWMKVIINLCERK